jgi:hypothetical protein
MIQAQRSKAYMAIVPQKITDGATATARVDTKGYSYATLLLQTSAEEGTDAGNATLGVLEADVTNVSSFATIVANQSVDNTAAKQTRYDIDLRSRKRYLRLTMTAASVTGSDLIVAGMAVLSRGSAGPASTADEVYSTDDAVVVV